MQSRPATTSAPATEPRLRGWLAERLYRWMDGHRWYWALGDPVLPTLRDWPVAPRSRARR